MKFIKGVLLFLEGMITGICYLAALVLYAGYAVEKILNFVFTLFAKASVFLVLTAALVATMVFIESLEPFWQNVFVSFLIYGGAASFISMVALLFWRPEKFNKIFGVLKKVKIKKDK